MAARVRDGADRSRRIEVVEQHDIGAVHRSTEFIGVAGRTVGPGARRSYADSTELLGLNGPAVRDRPGDRERGAGGNRLTEDEGSDVLDLDLVDRLIGRPGDLVGVAGLQLGLRSWIAAREA